MALSGSITPAQRFQLAVNAGFTAPNAIVMAAISMLECGNCDMSKGTPNYDKNGNLASTDNGLWQINSGHGYSASALADPATNAAAAFAVWKQQGFDGWCTYPGGCGGTSKTTWPQFQSIIGQVQASILQSGGTDIPLPSQTDTFDPSPGGVFGGSVGQIPIGNQASALAQGVKLGSIAGQPIVIPTGLVIGLLGVLLLILGALIFSSQLNLNLPKTPASKAPDMASWGRGFEAGKQVAAQE